MNVLGLGSSNLQATASAADLSSIRFSDVMMHCLAGWLAGCWLAASLIFMDFHDLVSWMLGGGPDAAIGVDGVDWGWLTVEVSGGLGCGTWKPIWQMYTLLSSCFVGVRNTH